MWWAWAGQGGWGLPALGGVGRVGDRERFLVPLLYLAIVLFLEANFTDNPLDHGSSGLEMVLLVKVSTYLVNVPADLLQRNLLLHYTNERG